MRLSVIFAVPRDIRCHRRNGDTAKLLGLEARIHVFRLVYSPTTKNRLWYCRDTLRIESRERDFELPRRRGSSTTFQHFFEVQRCCCTNILAGQGDIVQVRIVTLHEALAQQTRPRSLKASPWGEAIINVIVGFSISQSAIVLRLIFRLPARLWNFRVWA